MQALKAATDGGEGLWPRLGLKVTRVLALGSFGFLGLRFRSFRFGAAGIEGQAGVAI